MAGPELSGTQASATMAGICSTGKRPGTTKTAKSNMKQTTNIGRKTGQETLYRVDGCIAWQWEHNENSGTSVWTQYWPNGQKKAQSCWKGKAADGPACRWDVRGKEISRTKFSGGVQVKTP